ncbi:LysR family transcriptional regulator [Roseateles cellulosilyticus]|uniref:LysR substrate-binding domain-containing protein n=1 Tax=Pelomonas cellulosilytica TaxID=2906762 RepID=A0ABS8XU73_9BURK|nr:LysR family transcriptional regulator [Pelomonas sp. P8]MCE4555277.1 LysR substrate-binding domain-containing protein [Pelomonas sp. P8]
MESNGLDLDQLRAFIAVADHLSFREAAEALHLSPPALSRRIERLEERVGARLLERTSRSVQLSSVGEAFLDRVRRVLEDLDGAVLGVHELASGHQGRITVAAIPSAATGFVPRALVRLADAYPGVRMRLMDGSLQETTLAVLGGQADLGICFDDAPIAGLQTAPLGPDPYVLALPPNHPWATRDAARLEELIDQPLVGLGGASGNRQLLDAQLKRLGLQLTVRHEAAHLQAVLGLVAAGLGVALVPRLAVAPGPAGVRVLSLEGRPLSRALAVCWSASRRLTPLAQRLVPLLRDAFEA